VVFLDPPYALPVEDLTDALTALRDHDWLAHEALVVLERSSRGAAPTWPDGFAADRTRRYGETVLWYGHATA
jgi:16S rRNA (guanine966-N2)-methyltransferase